MGQTVSNENTTRHHRTTEWGRISWRSEESVLEHRLPQFLSHWTRLNVQARLAFSVRTLVPETFDVDQVDWIAIEFSLKASKVDEENGLDWIL